VRPAGSLAAADHLKAKLGIDFSETTADGRFTLKEGECMGACAMAPVVLVNNKKMHDYMSNEKLDALHEGAEMTHARLRSDAILMKAWTAELAPEGLRGADGYRR
jgi:NADH-quinone oxidoreductase subunit E